MGVSQRGREMTGQGKPVETIARHRATWQEKTRDMPLSRTGGAALYLREGDMVVDESDGAIGLLTRLGTGAEKCTIMVAQNVESGGRRWRSIRQATPTEIEEAGLSGVGCNPYRGRR